jgi:glutamate/tyrosine decarboxylase-like PLP-dependent enzyme
VARNARGGEDGALAQKGLYDLKHPPVFLASEHAHFSFQKAANLLGLGRDAWIRVPADGHGRVRVDAMEEALRLARQEGRRPFCLIGVAGTTVTGSLDPLQEIGELAEREGLWFHVDAAYGGAIALSEELRGRLKGIERADSVTFNPQKWLFVPKTCATILFRDRLEVERHLREPFLYGTSNRSLDQRLRVNLGEWTLQGTRRVDALKLYLTLEHFGRARLARMMERNLELAGRFASAVASCPELEAVNEPDLNLVCFRYRGLPHWPEWVEDDSPLDRLNARIHERIEQAGHAWLSLPRYRNRSVLRAVVLHPRCDEILLDRLLEEIRQAGRELMGAGT